MRTIFLSGLVIAFVAVARVPATSHAQLPVCSAPGISRKASASTAPLLTGLQIFFRGQPQPQLISGNKIKKYRLQRDQGVGMGARGGAATVGALD